MLYEVNCLGAYFPPNQHGDSQSREACKSRLGAAETLVQKAWAASVLPHLTGQQAALGKSACPRERVAGLQSEFSGGSSSIILTLFHLQ